MAKKTAVAAPHPGGKKPAAAEVRGPTVEDRFAAFSARYKWHFFAPILVAIVAVTVLAIASAHRKSRERASLAASRAAGSIEELDAVALKYPGNFVGGRALVRAGDLLYGQGKYAEARAKYEAYLATKPDPVLGVLARTAIVQTYIAEQDYAGGIKACNEILGTEGRESVEMQAIYYKAYCYELSGDLKAAKVEYEKLTKGERQGGSWSLLAGQRLEEVSRKLDTGRNAVVGEKNPEKAVDTPGNG